MEGLKNSSINNNNIASSISTSCDSRTVAFYSEWPSSRYLVPCMVGPGFQNSGNLIPLERFFHGFGSNLRHVCKKVSCANTAPCLPMRDAPKNPTAPTVKPENSIRPGRAFVCQPCIRNEIDWV